MSRYRPGLDDDRMVGEALDVLAHETEALQAPPAVEACLRAAFRQATGAPAPPRVRSNAWKWVAAVGAAAGLIWVAYASLRAQQKPSDPRDSEHRDSEVSKTGPQRSRSAAAPFRRKGSLGFVAEPMLYRRTANPSRRRIVSPAAKGRFFHGAKRSAESTTSLRRVRSGAAAFRPAEAGRHRTAYFGQTVPWSTAVTGARPL